jgi:hypothetical protein
LAAEGQPLYYERPFALKHQKMKVFWFFFIKKTGKPFFLQKAAKTPIHAKAPKPTPTEH